MDILETITPLIKLFLMMVPGFLLSKANSISEDQNKALAKMVVNVTWPCLAVDSMQIAFSMKRLINAGFIVLFFLSIIMVAYTVSRLTSRLIRMEKSASYLFTFMLLFGNTGMMGLPIVNALFGKEGVFYAVLMDALLNIGVFTIGVYLVQKSVGKEAGVSAKTFLTPGMISIAIGIALFLTDTRLPAVLGESVEMIGSATAPVAMTAIGFQLGRIKLKELIGDVRIYILSSLRLVFIPLFFLISFKLLFGEPDLFAKVILTVITMPVAASCTIFAQKLDGDAVFTTKGVLLSTVLSMFTIPVFALLI